MQVTRFLKINMKLNYNTHDLRHTKITDLANSGMPVTTIQRFVGHANSSTTMRYI
jgi:integrase